MVKNSSRFYCPGGGYPFSLLPFLVGFWLSDVNFAVVVLILIPPL